MIGSVALWRQLEMKYVLKWKVNRVIKPVILMKFKVLSIMLSD